MDNATFAARLKAARQSQYLRIVDAAEILGVKPATLGKWERGDTEPQLAAFAIDAIERRLRGGS